MRDAYTPSPKAVPSYQIITPTKHEAVLLYIDIARYCQIGIYHFLTTFMFDKMHEPSSDPNLPQV